MENEKQRFPEHVQKCMDARQDVEDCINEILSSFEKEHNCKCLLAAKKSNIRRLFLGVEIEMGSLNH